VRRKSDKYEKFDTGDAWIRENTGSATQINVDGQWEHNFVDDEEPGEKNKQDKNR